MADDVMAKIERAAADVEEAVAQLRAAIPHNHEPHSEDGDVAALLAVACDTLDGITRWRVTRDAAIAEREAAEAEAAAIEEASKA